jgi:CRISPR-associated protein Cas6
MPAPPAGEMVDLAFGLAGASLPAEHGFALDRAIAARLDWWDAERSAGVHPVRGARTDRGTVLLSKRARLLLRVPAARVAAARALEGAGLEVGGHRIDIGSARVWPLLAHPTLYSPRVATGAASEAEFVAAVDRELLALGVACKLICGRRTELAAGNGAITAFGLALHDLKAPQSLLVQAAGLGGERRLGCGIFVAHKLITGLD